MDSRRTPSGTLRFCHSKPPFGAIRANRWGTPPEILQLRQHHYERKILEENFLLGEPYLSASSMQAD